MLRCIAHALLDHAGAYRERSGPAAIVADISAINHRPSFANLSPRIRILNRPAIPGEGIRRSGRGRATLVRNFLAHRLHFIRGSVQ